MNTCVKTKYIRPDFSAHPDTIKIMMDNYHFPLTANLNYEYEEETANVFKRYKSWATTQLIYADLDYTAWRIEDEFIENATITQEIKDALVEALRLHDLDALL